MPTVPQRTFAAAHTTQQTWCTRCGSCQHCAMLSRVHARNVMLAMFAFASLRPCSVDNQDRRLPPRGSVAPDDAAAGPSERSRRRCCCSMARRRAGGTARRSVSQAPQAKCNSSATRAAQARAVHAQRCVARNKADAPHGSVAREPCGVHAQTCACSAMHMPCTPLCKSTAQHGNCAREHSIAT